MTFDTILSNSTIFKLMHRRKKYKLKPTRKATISEFLHLKGKCQNKDRVFDNC